MNYTFDFTHVWEGFPNLLWGCLGTLGLSLGGMALAIVIGIGGVVLRDSRFQPLRWLTIAFVETIRNTPFLVQIYFIFFAMISNQIFKPLLVFGIVGIIYFIICWPLSLYGTWLERQFAAATR